MSAGEAGANKPEGVRAEGAPRSGSSTEPRFSEAGGGHTSAYELIKRKRDGGRLTAAEVQDFLWSYTKGVLPDYQAAAMLMAVFFRGLDPDELAAWTRGMLESGEILDLSAIPGRKVDKHSTGGVGDKISIPLAPLAAACGAKIPMIAGRGLGHTGGTLDKLEAIPGFRVNLTVEEFRDRLQRIGVCLLGQTEEIAPADRKLYALRDATATVESIPLICSSIMSKKLAEGTDGLVLDVKVGNGAFMKRIEDARALAATMVETGRRMGRDVVALLTDMNQPLGHAIGNSLEIEESIEILQGRGPRDVAELTVELGAEMLVLARLAGDLEAGRAQIRRAIADGSGLAKFGEIIEAQGGDPGVIDSFALLPQARCIREVAAPASGWVAGIQTEEVGLAAMALGAGRARKEDAIDPAVGFRLLRKVGDRVEAGEAIALAYVNDEGRAEDALRRLAASYNITEQAPAPTPLFLDRIA